MRIIFTESFKKSLKNLWHITQSQIVNLIQKYPHTSQLIIIDEFDSTKILKWYLYSKKIRILILFEQVKGVYIPISIIKKETKKWENIMKKNYIEIFGNDIEKAISDYENDRYTETNINKTLWNSI